MDIYHVTAWQEVLQSNGGDEFTLKVGNQNAEGPGVYFSQGAPRYSAAEGSTASDDKVVIVISPKEGTFKSQWWRTKGANKKKHGKVGLPRTWHTLDQKVRCVVDAISINDMGYKEVRCSFTLV